MNHMASTHIPARLIGRETELRLARVSLECGRNLLLEGPVGVGKSVLALHLLGLLSRPHVRVDGDERYTEQKMAGWFDPPLVLQKGYAPEHFIPGPLYQAMKEGGVLFINEINRLPESVQNLLLPALDERLTTVPYLGPLRARAGFSVIATMNPREFIATSELSEALRDRFEIVYLDYQSAEEEAEIVKVNLGPEVEDHGPLVEKAVAITRRTRQDPRIRRGASVRAAIAMVDLALKLGGMKGLAEAARLALPNRIEMREESNGQILDVINELVEDGKKKRDS